MNMKSFNRALCTILALSIALPWNVFASSVPTDAEPAATYDDPADFLAKLPDEVKIIETVSESSEEYAALPVSEVTALKPLGRAIQNKKTNATLQFVCLQDVANVPDCARFQLRKDGAWLVGPQYVIKTMKKEILASHLRKKMSSDQSDRKWDYIGYNDTPVRRWFDDSCWQNCDFMPWFLNEGIVYGSLIGLLSFLMSGWLAGIGVISAGIFASGVFWLALLGVSFFPFVAATAMIVAVDLPVMNRNLIANIGGAIRAHRANKTYRAMMDEKQSDRKPYRTSNKNFEYLLKNLATVQESGVIL